MNIQVSKLTPDAIIPTYAHDGDAGCDLYSTIDCVVPRAQFATTHTGNELTTIRMPGQTTIVSTGLTIAIPSGCEGQIRSRSGLAIKSQIVVINSPGTLDSGYRGEIKVGLINHGSEDYQIKKGDRVAQLLITPVIRAAFIEVDSLGDTSDRGTGGFGSSGK
jgi:dUTP pyrophosphatase